MVCHFRFAQWTRMSLWRCSSNEAGLVLIISVMEILLWGIFVCSTLWRRSFSMLVGSMLKCEKEKTQKKLTTTSLLELVLTDLGLYWSYFKMTKLLCRICTVQYHESTIHLCIEHSVWQSHLKAKKFFPQQKVQNVESTHKKLEQNRTIKYRSSTKPLKKTKAPCEEQYNCKVD